jgi:hypothetical protein
LSEGSFMPEGWQVAGGLSSAVHAWTVSCASMISIV